MYIYQDIRFYLYYRKSIQHSEKEDNKFHTINIWTFEIFFEERFLQYLPANCVLLGF